MDIIFQEMNQHFIPPQYNSVPQNFPQSRTSPSLTPQEFQNIPLGPTKSGLTISNGQQQTVEFPQNMVLHPVSISSPVGQTGSTHSISGPPLNISHNQPPPVIGQNQIFPGQNPLLQGLNQTPPRQNQTHSDWAQSGSNVTATEQSISHKKDFNSSLDQSQFPPNKIQERNEETSQHLHNGANNATNQFDGSSQFHTSASIVRNQTNQPNIVPPQSQFGSLPKSSPGQPTNQFGQPLSQPFVQIQKPISNAHSGPGQINQMQQAPFNGSVPPSGPPDYSKTLDPNQFVPQPQQSNPNPLNEQMQGLSVSGSRQHFGKSYIDGLNMPPRDQQHYLNGPQAASPQGIPPATSHQPLSIPGQPPMPGQPSIPGQPSMPGQPPVPGQPPMQGQPPMPGQPPISVQSPIPGQPPMSGQLPISGQPPMQRQPFISGQPPMSRQPPPLQQSQFGQPLMPGYPPMSGPTSMPAQPPMPGHPLMYRQPQVSRQPPMPGQQPFSGHPQMSGPPAMFGQPPMPGQPPMLNQPPMSGPPMMSGEQPPVYGQPPMASGPYPQSPYQQPQQQPRRLDPDQMPSPVSCPNLQRFS